MFAIPLAMPHSTCLLPEGSFDTHVHVFDPNVGPYDGSRAYTPPDAPLKDLVDFSSKLNSSDSPLNLILVQPSPYGTDNHVLLQSLRQLQKNPKIVVRGIAVVDVLQVTDVDLVQMHQVGVRGLRLNLQSAGKGVNLEQLKLTLLTASQKIQHLPGWRLQVFAPAAVWSGMAPVSMSMASPH
jgi:predicted TIM-barrel fold metal-dependent hydrolase